MPVITWREDWGGRSWDDAVLYELHLGAFTPEGTFIAAAEKLDHLASLGVTAVEIMPVGDFSGRWGWGYDGVLPYAPDASYGRPEHFKAFVEAAHRRGISVSLDVVYNHFGPHGNYLPRYAPDILTDRHKTPWGDAINFDGPNSGPVREFFLQNAEYWIDAFHLDGLRLDAAHAIKDDSRPDVLDELAERDQKALYATDPSGDRKRVERSRASDPPRPDPPPLYSAVERRRPSCVACRRDPGVRAATMPTMARAGCWPTPSRKDLPIRGR